MPEPTSSAETATLDLGVATEPRASAGTPGALPDAPGEAFSLIGRTAEQRIAELEAEVGSLRAGAERARRLLDSATDHAVITMNLGGRVMGWNTGARIILGYADAEILGRSGEVFFPAEDRARGVFPGELCRALDDGHAQNERRHLRRDGSRLWASGMMLPLLDHEGNAEGFLNVFRDNTATRAEDERRNLLLAEMGHRVKNTLATVQAVASQTLRSAGVPQEVQETFSARLVALARAHDLLIRSDWEGASLAEVAERALLPYGGSDRAMLGGPPVQLSASVVEMLGLPSTSSRPTRPSTAPCRCRTAGSRSAGACCRRSAGTGRWRSPGSGVGSARDASGQQRLRVAAAGAGTGAELRRHGKARLSARRPRMPDLPVGRPGRRPGVIRRNDCRDEIV